MTIKELIQAEMEQLNETELQEIYRFMQEHTKCKQKINKQSLMSKLSQIKIDAPKDFSINFDLYTNGEKNAE